MPAHASPPAIARIWRGRTRRDVADEYEAYNYEVGIKPLIEKAMGVQTLREDRADETEFITISYWESIDAMSRFTGGDPMRIHHLDRDPEFLIELPGGVQILRIRRLSREHRWRRPRLIRRCGEILLFPKGLQGVCHSRAQGWHERSGDADAEQRRPCGRERDGIERADIEEKR